MIGRNLKLGLCVTGALLASAIVAQGASAIAGTTAFTCKKVEPKAGTAGFSKAHCKTSDAVSTGAEYEHFTIEQGKTTELTGTNEGTGAETNATSIWRLRSTIAGVPIELSADGVHAEGTLVNVLEPSGEHVAKGEGTVTFTKVKVTQPVGSKCEVFTDNGGAPGAVEVVHSTALKGTTKGQGHSVKIEPVAGNVLATFIIEKCVEPFKVLEGTYAVIGSVTGIPDGATLNFTHSTTTESKTLHLKSAVGPVAGLEGSITLSGRANNTEPFTPLSPTTVVT
ncbi:MAG TPA: hypothetical protein VLL27_13915 [Solirubrobacterales bacterium]|nr:hypothetical protein [Solirubrobacterales bacterium]